MEIHDFSLGVGASRATFPASNASANTNPLGLRTQFHPLRDEESIAISREMKTSRYKQLVGVGNPELSVSDPALSGSSASRLSTNNTSPGFLKHELGETTSQVLLGGTQFPITFRFQQVISGATRLQNEGKKLADLARELPRATLKRRRGLHMSMSHSLAEIEQQREIVTSGLAAIMRVIDSLEVPDSASAPEQRSNAAVAPVTAENISMQVAPVAEPRGKAECLLVELIQRLTDLHDLDVNWDSYGALPISLRAEAVTRELLVAFWNAGLIPDDPNFDLMPVPTGGLQLEWTGNNGELEIEVRSDGSLSILRVLPGGDLVHSLSDPEPDVDAMKALISEVLG